MPSRRRPLLGDTTFPSAAVWAAALEIAPDLREVDEECGGVNELSSDAGARAVAERNRAAGEDVASSAEEVTFGLLARTIS